MKKVLAFSDSHNTVIPDGVMRVADESDYIFFAGDGFADINYRFSYMTERLIVVRGNCDGVSAADEKTVQVEDVKFLIVHGHRFQNRLDLVYRAKELDCDVVLYGHTHAFSDEVCDGIRLINTGSMGHSRYGDNGYVYIVVNGKNIFVNFVKIL